MNIGDYRFHFDKVRVYKEIDADIYCVFGVSNLAAEIAAFCRAYGKLFILFAGSGSDYSEEYFDGSKNINPYGSVGELCYYAIKECDFLITQTYSQQKIFQERFKKQSIVILNPVDLSKHETHKIDSISNCHALWIGKSDKIKRPEVLIKLAIDFQEIKFIMILNCSDASTYEQIISSKPENVEIIERCPLFYIERLFVESFVLINTSVFEGFPNTFLQAGKYGVPILSLLVDPDDFIKKYSCGIVAGGQYEKLSEGLRIISTQSETAREISNNVKKYTTQYHDLQCQISKLDHFFKGINEKENPPRI